MERAKFLRDRKGIYRHYKGNLYRVLGVGKHSETLDDVVIYQALYFSEEFGNSALWVCPVSLFLEEVSVDGKKVKRFTFVQEDNFP